MLVSSRDDNLGMGIGYPLGTLADGDGYDFLHTVGPIPNLN
jgi:hypothetical protein